MSMRVQGFVQGVGSPIPRQNVPLESSTIPHYPKYETLHMTFTPLTPPTRSLGAPAPGASLVPPPLTLLKGASALGALLVPTSLIPWKSVLP